MICFICHQQPDVGHDHHLKPQAVGGKNDITFTLCANCHNAVHKEISRLLALYKNGACDGTVNWKTCRHPQEIEKAKNVILFGLSEIINFSGDKDTKVVITLNQELHNAVKMLKIRTGASNIPSVIIECIKYVIKSGI